MKITLGKDVKTTKEGEAAYWVARWYDAAGKRRSKSIGKVDTTSVRAERKSRKQAENAIVLMQKEFQDTPTKANAGKAPALLDFTKMYLDHKKHEFEPKSLALVKRAIEFLKRNFGETRRIDTIAPVDALGFKAALADGKLKNKDGKARDLSLQSVNIYLRQIKAMFGYAVTAELLTANPFAKTVSKIKGDKNWHYVTQEELTKIMDAALPDVAIVIALCRLAGLRRGEAIALEWENVNWENGSIEVVEKDGWKPKDKESRIVPMCKELADILLVAHENAPEGQTKVCTPSVLNLNQNVLRAIRRAGLPRYAKPLHTLRKCCLSDWASNNPLHAVKDWAGHSSIETTEKHYLKSNDKDFRNVSGASFWNDCTENGRKIENQTEKAPAIEQGALS